MSTNQYNSNNSRTMGKSAEQRFVNLITTKYPSHILTKATVYQDMYEHWDYKIADKNGKNAKKIDVKSIKRINRWDANTQEDYIWIELRNVKGNHGWLYGDADFIAFEYGKGFILVKRVKLLEKCESLTGYTLEEVNQSNAGSKKELYKLYSRYGKDDVLTIITKDDVLTLNHKRLEI